jgi:hypothetical protein
MAARWQHMTPAVRHVQYCTVQYSTVQMVLYGTVPARLCQYACTTCLWFVSHEKRLLLC